MSKIAFALWPLAVLAAALPAQVPSEPKFDIVSIKPSAPGARMRADSPAGGTFVYQAAPLKLMMMQAFEVQETQITGDPDWAESALWDVTAKVENESRPLGPAAVNPRLRALLAERFGLKTHRETKQEPVFALVLAKGGPKMKRAGEARGSLVGSVRVSFFRGAGVGLARLTQVLAASLGRPVVDRTGLSGEFDFELSFSPDSVPDRGWPGNRPTAADQPPGDPSKPTLFVALEEQLGLKLESTKGPVEMLVVDHVERPSEN